MFYIEPYRNGQIMRWSIKKGDKIGVAQDISQRYGPECTPHIHVEMYKAFDYRGKMNESY